VGQLISGFLRDRVRPSHLLAAGLFATALSNLLMPLLPSVAMIPLWAVNGLAQAMLWPPIVRILADTLEHERFVKANLLVTCAAHLSTVLLYLYVPLTISVANWRLTFYTASVMAFATGVILVVLAAFTILGDKPEKEQKTVPVSNSKAKNDNNYLHIALVAGVPTVILAITAMGFLRDGIETWLPTLLTEAFSMRAEQSILISVALPVFSALSITVITVLHKTRMFANEVLGAISIFSLAVIAAILLVFTVGGISDFARGATLTLACLVSGFMHAINFLYISCLPGRFAPYGRAATTSGLCNAFTYVGAAISMTLNAGISDRFGWGAVMLLWSGVALLGAVFSIPSLKHYTGFIDKGEQK
jgi:OPA family glycerol-3-phosphate transporter-like MFS transporter